MLKLAERSMETSPEDRVSNSNSTNSSATSASFRGSIFETDDVLQAKRLCFLTFSKRMALLALAEASLSLLQMHGEDSMQSSMNPT